MSAKIFDPDRPRHTEEPKKPFARCQFVMNTVNASMEPLNKTSGEGFRRKRRQSVYAKPINAVWELFSDYSNCSTIHGLRYLGEKRRHWSERIWWAIACLLSLTICGHLIVNTWRKWEEFPVLVTFAEKSTHIDQIPFPAVTVCPSTQIKQSLFNYTTAFNQLKNGDRMPESNLTTMRTVSNLCYLINKTLTAREMYANDSKLFKTFSEYVPTLQDVIFQCTWHGKKSTCTDYFHPIWTSEGLCFTFNLLNASDFYTERRLTSHIPTTVIKKVHKSYGPQPSGMPPPATTTIGTTTTTTSKPRKPQPMAEGKIKRAILEKMYPRRVAASSDNLVVEMRLFDKDTDYLCEGPVQGFKVLLHTVHEMPQMDKYFYRIPLDHETIVSVKPELMETSDSLTHYSSSKRQCYFDAEHPLTYFRVYTQRNCELECLTAKTLRLCNCVTFSMPRDNLTRVCGLARKSCYSGITLSLEDNCNCLPACKSITYDAELSFARYNRRRFQNGMNRTFQDRRQYVRMSISFKDNQFFASNRRELYGPTEFLANCGGLLGLFMGFSLLSIVEVVYYCTLRLACNLHRRRKAKAKAAMPMAVAADGCAGGWGEVLTGYQVKT